MRYLIALILVLLCPVTAWAANTPPAGNFPAIQFNNNGRYGALSADTLASYAAHDTVMNGISYDPRNYGAICGGYNIFTSDGHTTTYNYTLPFVGSSSSDNSSFFVYIESDGVAPATVLSTSDFSVTGVNSGVGGTITLHSAPSNGNTIIVAHDDAAGFIAASTAAASTGGYVAVPGSISTTGDCTIYGSQTSGTQLAEGAQLIGQSFTPNYGFQGQGTKPIIRVMAPTGAAPAYGFNISGKKQQFYEGFEITTNVPGHSQFGFLDVPVLIGANTSAGAGGGQSPGITVQYVTFNDASVGFGAPIGGSSGYIFSVLRFNNFVGNNAGVYGPLSDLVAVGNDFSSNGSFGSLASAGGMVIGPQEGAVGVAGASRLESNRFEFNREGIVVQSASLVNMEGNQFDGNSACGLDLRGAWSFLNLTGGWFRGNANNGSGGTGNVTAGQDAHICINGTGNSFHVTNTNFIDGFARGFTAPLGSANANTPPYVLDVTATGVDDVSFDGATAQFAAGNNGASVTDFAIYRNGRPTNLKIDLTGQAVQGKIANGSFSSQARGLPSNQWGAYYAFGDASSVFNSQFTPLSNGYAAIVGKKLGVAPNYYVVNDFSHSDCDVVQQQIIPNVNPTLANNPLMTWLPSLTEPSFGGGFFTAHLADTHTCHLGALTWMAVPRSYKVYGQSSGCVETGAGWYNSANYTGYYGVTDSTNADSLACTVTTNGGPIYAWYGMDTTSGGTFTWQLDSTTTGSVTVAGSNALGAGTASMGAVRIPTPSAGSHTVSFSLTSTTTSSNPVTLYGIGTPPAEPYDGSLPMVVFGGQIPNASFPAASTAFNNDEYNMATQLFSDGLQIGFADVQSKFVSTDLPFGNQTHLSAPGQLHVADAFDATIQGSWNSMNAVNPLDYGAACNAQLFNNNFNNGGFHGVTTTDGSPVVSVANYIFQPGVATQNGGGDVGKVWSMNGSNTVGDQGITTYILSVDTTANTATLGESMVGSTGGNGMALMGGYPTNPNDPSTARDDTIPIQNASNAAVLGGGVVALPPNCMVHNLVMHSQTALVGNNGGNDYNEFSGYPNFTNTPLYVAATGFSDDIDTITGLARSVGIDTSRSTQVKLKDFTLVCPDFPFLPPGMYLAGIGEQKNTQTDLSPDHILVDHLTITGCPVAFNEPKGNNFTVTFTGQITGNVLTVTAITSTNFSTAGLPGVNGIPDFLAVGRPITGTNVTGGTVITSQLSNTSTAGFSGLTGTYSLNVSSTTSSEAMTSTPNAAYTSGTMQNTQMAQDGMGINGDLSDFTWTNNIGTDYNYCVFLGPPSGTAGTEANRFNGGRCETGGGMFFYGGGNDQLTGVQFQATNCAIQTAGSGGQNSHLQITGGWMQGNDCNHAAGLESQIMLGGGFSKIDISGVSSVFNNFGGGGNTNSKYFVQTSTGYTGDYLSIEGGDMQNAGTVSFTNFTQGTPTHYKQDVAGLAKIDTMVIPVLSGLAFTSTSGGIYSGAAISNTTTTAGVLNLTGLPAVTGSWSCQGGDATLANTWPMSATTSTSCALNATTSVGDKVYWSGTAHP